MFFAQAARKPSTGCACDDASRDEGNSFRAPRLLWLRPSLPSRIGTLVQGPCLYGGFL
jgi:hypothetical protein